MVFQVPKREGPGAPGEDVPRQKATARTTADPSTPVAKATFSQDNSAFFVLAFWSPTLAAKAKTRRGWGTQHGLPGPQMRGTWGTRQLLQSKNSLWSPTHSAKNAE